MIDFKDRSSWGATGVTAFCLVAMIGIAVYMEKAPKPVVNAHSHEVNDAKTAINLRNTTETLAKNQKVVAQHAYSATEQEIEPELLRSLGETALKHKVKLSAFRPQRSVDNSGLTILPYQLSIEGTYLNVLAFANDLEVQADKIALTQILLSSADGNTDKVNATVGVAAYNLPPSSTKKS